LLISYLFPDTIGLVTGLSSKREYLRDSKVTKMIVVELTDHTFVFCFWLLIYFILFFIYFIYVLTDILGGYFEVGRLSWLCSVIMFPSFRK
jgi:hypothetical protein